VNREQFDRLLREEPDEPTIAAADVVGRDRTLIWGYNHDRIDVHVYLSRGEIHLLTFDQSGVVHYAHNEVWRAPQLLPTRRAFPECTDEEFARLLLLRLGLKLSFTAFNADRWRRTQGHPFQAPRRQDLQPSRARDRRR
jgi:hypothetical protein